MSQMRQVTQKEFYEAIGPLDVVGTVRGSYYDEDYGSDFRLRRGGGSLLGRTRNVGETPHYKPDTEYFLSSSYLSSRSFAK